MVRQLCYVTNRGNLLAFFQRFLELNAELIVDRLMNQRPLLLLIIYLTTSVNSGCEPSALPTVTKIMEVVSAPLMSRLWTVNL